MKDTKESSNDPPSLEELSNRVKALESLVMLQMTIINELQKQLDAAMKSLSPETVYLRSPYLLTEDQQISIPKEERNKFYCHTDFNKDDMRLM